MVLSRFKPHVRTALESFTAPLQLVGASPNGVTLLSFVVAVGAAIAFFQVNHLAGFSLFIISSIFDAFDGALARKTDRVTRFGAYLDSVTDKMVEALIFFCFGVYDWPLSFLAATTSIIISYSRHRADEFGVKVTGGIFERPERIGFILASGIVLEAGRMQNLIPYALGITIILSAVTILQRILGARKLLA